MPAACLQFIGTHTAACPKSCTVPRYTRCAHPYVILSRGRQLSVYHNSHTNPPCHNFKCKAEITKLRKKHDRTLHNSLPRCVFLYQTCLVCYSCRFLCLMSFKILMLEAAGGWLFASPSPTPQPLYIIYIIYIC